MNPFTACLAQAIAGVSALRNSLYDRGWLGQVRIDRPVVSLGNLTVGGTGKTPVAAFCLRLLLDKKHRPALICRSYRGSLKQPRRVRADDDPGVVGDEALWFARKFPDVSVWSGPSKSESAKALAAAEDGVDLVIVDDGYQHRRLHRDLNLLLLDATEALKNYATLPAGRARESFAGITRADAIFWTKQNWALGNERPAVPGGKPEFGFDFVLRAPVAAPARALLVSGVARPESFSRQARALWPETEFREIAFRDHHPYDSGDIETILRQAQEFGAELVLTTEKDEVKLRPIWHAGKPPLYAAQLEAGPVGSVESIYALFARTLG